MIDVVDSNKDITEDNNDSEVASAQTGIVKDQVWRDKAGGTEDSQGIGAARV